MARVQLYIRTIKHTGSIKIRFRLTDGRTVQLFHKSNIVADIADLHKFEIDGTPKKRANYNRSLAKAIRERMQLLYDVYAETSARGILLSSASFQRRINEALHSNPDNRPEQDRRLVERFGRYIINGCFSTQRAKDYKGTWLILKRFVSIYAIDDITIDEVTPDFIMNFREFIINEYQFADKDKFRNVYADLKAHQIPTAPRAQNTTAVKLKQLQAFFASLENADEVSKSPFRRLGRENRRIFLSEQYVAPVALTLEEVRSILAAEVPQSLQAARDAFLLQCALGCRISDFRAMRMRDVAVSADGVPYVRYVAQKTRHTQKTLRQTETPLVRFAFDIVKKNNFVMPVLNCVSGESCYNGKIKLLLKHCGIEREVEVHGGAKGPVERKPLWETASSKLARKTNVTLLSRVQINNAIAGLHAEGSDAIKHYLDLSKKDLFLLMSKAFGEAPFKVTNRLEVVE